MNRPAFTADDVRLGEAIFRSEAHCAVCCELYGAGRRADALLQAARPITDVLPWLETELRSCRAGLRRYTVSVARVGAEVRKGAKPRSVRQVLAEVPIARSALLEEAIGPEAASPRYLVSVAVALLTTLGSRYVQALRSQNLNDYQSAYALAQAAASLFDEAGAASGEEWRRDVAILRAAFPSIEPPEGLWRPGAVAQAIDRLAELAARDFGVTGASPTYRDSLAKVDRILADVETSYSEGIPALAARLASSLFVRTFHPIAGDVEAADPHAAAELARLLGTDLRRAINAGAPSGEIERMVADARTAIRRLEVPRTIDLSQEESGQIG